MRRTLTGLQVAVIGCGVSGLTCGVRLLEHHYAVTIVARDLPPQTTSDAAAFWFPSESAAACAYLAALSAPQPRADHLR